MAFALYLQSKSLTYPKFVQAQSKTEENVFFSQLIDRRNFYFFGNKAKINQVIDLRVEDMVLNPQFYQQVVDYAQQLSEVEDASF